MGAAGTTGRVRRAADRVDEADRSQAEPGAERIELQRGLIDRDLAIEIDPRDRVPVQGSRDHASREATALRRAEMDAERR